MELWFEICSFLFQEWRYQIAVLNQNTESRGVQVEIVKLEENFVTEKELFLK